MKPLIWDYRPDGLRAPALACAFRGWNDAGDASTTALKVIGRSLDSRRFARIDAEEFFDFQTHRPIVELSDGVTREIRWPRNDFREAHVPEASRDLVLLTANEPSMKWRTYCQTVLDLGDALGAQLVVTLGSLLAEVPHSRPTPLTGLASDPALLSSMEIEPPNYEGPTGIAGVFQDACVAAGIPAVTFWAAVPHYVSQPPNPKATVALLRRVVGVPVRTFTIGSTWLGNASSFRVCRRVSAGLV